MKTVTVPRKWRLPVVTLLMAALVLAGCAQQAAPTTSAPAQDSSPSSQPAASQPSAPAQPAPKLLNMATHGLGSLINALGTGLGTVLNKYVESETKVIPTTGPAEWLPQIATGEVHMGILNNYDALHGRHATEGYAKALGGQGAPIMLVTSGTDNLNAPLTHKDSGITSCADMKGKRVIDTYTASAGVDAQGKGAIANCGLQSGEYTSVAVPAPPPGVQAVTEGRADVTTSAAIGMGDVTELDAKKGARFLSLDPDRWDEYTKHYPAELVKIEPGPNRIGIVEPTWMASYPFYLVAAENLPDDLVYGIVKTLWEKNEELFPLHPRLRDWNKEGFVDEHATIPYHPGAVKFYKEVGAWSDQMEQAQQRLLQQ